MPQIMLIKSWWFGFVIWFGNAFYGATPFKYGELILMKLPSILADLGIGILIYFLGKRVIGPKNSLLLATIYLFSPFSWYESGVWGQVDQLAFLLILLAVILIPAGYVLISPIMIVAAILIKPTTLVFLPLWLWIVAKKDFRRIIAVTLGSLGAMVLYYLLARLFSDLPLRSFNDRLLFIVFHKGPPFTWVSAYNFWRLVNPGRFLSWDLLLGIPLGTWAIFLYAPFYLLALWMCRKKDLVGILRAVFLVAFAGWMFMLTMHERYFFPAVAAGLILVIYKKELFKYWLAISFIYFLNLYYGWWYPSQLGILKDIMLWQGDLVPRILSAINLIIFFRMIMIIGVREEVESFAMQLKSLLNLQTKI